MKRNALNIAAVVLFTLGLGAGDCALHTRQACRYFHAYCQVKQADSKLGLVQRLLCTVVVANAGDQA